MCIVRCGRACRGLFVVCLCSLLRLRYILVCVLFVFWKRCLLLATETLLKPNKWQLYFNAVSVCVCVYVCVCFFSGIQDSRFIIEEKLINSPVVRTMLKWNSHSTHHALVTIHILGSFLKKGSLSVQHQVVQRVPNVLSRLLVFSQTLRSKPWSVDDPFYLGASNYMGNERKNMLKKKYPKTSNSSPPLGEVAKIFFEVPWISPDSTREARTLEQRECVRSSAADVKTKRFVVGTQSEG